MNDEYQDYSYEELNAYDTPSLLEIWQCDVSDLDDALYEILQKILVERLGFEPLQSIEAQLETTTKAIEKHLANNELTQALSESEIAIQINPTYAAAYFLRGEIYDKMDELEQALDSYRKAVQLDPGLENAWDYAVSIEQEIEAQFEKSETKRQLDKALDHARRKQPESAIAECEAAKPALPNIASAHNYLGLVYQTLGELEPAIEAYQEAVRLNPTHKDAWKNLLSIEAKIEAEFQHSEAKRRLDLALDYINYDELEKALAECEQAKSNIPSIASAYNHYGLVLQSAGQLEAAIEAYQKAVQCNPRYSTARRNLAQARRRWQEEQFRTYSNSTGIDNL